MLGAPTAPVKRQPRVRGGNSSFQQYLSECGLSAEPAGDSVLETIASRSRFDRRTNNGED
jgi:hypothetical protein